MSKLTELPKLIQEEKAEEFLETYLQLIAEGFTLSIPKSSEPTEQSWKRIISRLYSDYKDSVIDTVSEEWNTLTNRFGTPKNKEDIEKILALLQKNQSQNKQNPRPRTIPLRQSTPLYEKPPLEGETLPQISEHYYKTEGAKHMQSLSNEEAILAQRTAIDETDVTAFLLATLATIKNGKTPELPKSSVQAIISEQWQGIILNTHHITAPDHFIQALAQRWTQLVNQHGIPSSEKTLHQLHIDLLANAEEKRPKQGPSSSLIKRLFLKK